MRGEGLSSHLLHQHGVHVARLLLVGLQRQRLQPAGPTHSSDFRRALADLPERRDGIVRSGRRVFVPSSGRIDNHDEGLRCLLDHGRGEGRLAALVRHHPDAVDRRLPHLRRRVGGVLQQGGEDRLDVARGGSIGGAVLDHVVEDAEGGGTVRRDGGGLEHPRDDGHQHVVEVGEIVRLVNCEHLARHLDERLHHHLLALGLAL
eukprot:scaffold19280_cov116-Isochrysis_galbana.AAC.3